jgi:hypothetical protein
MLAGLSHSDNRKYEGRHLALLNNMAERVDTYPEIFYRDYSVDQWRNLLKAAPQKIDGIVILDEKVPVPKIYRGGRHPDHGIADNIYGNISKQILDKGADGYFEIEDMPEEYHQDCFVCRLVPYSIAYYGVGWWEWFRHLWQERIWDIRDKRSYGFMLDYWSEKLNRITAEPLTSFVATCDWSGVDEENKKGFNLDMEKLRSEDVFKIDYGQYDLEFSDPIRKEGVQRMWFKSALGTAWHSGHSANSQLGDFRYESAYKNLQEERGPTLLLTYACSVGEWQMNPNYNIISNIFNSRENNNIKCICGSGILQWGAGFQTHLGFNSEENTCLFELMKKYMYKPFGFAQRDWINEAYKFYIKRGGEFDKQFLINFLAMNITGDATVLL